MIIPEVPLHHQHSEEQFSSVPARLLSSHHLTLRSLISALSRHQHICASSTPSHIVSVSPLDQWLWPTQCDPPWSSSLTTRLATAISRRCSWTTKILLHFLNQNSPCYWCHWRSQLHVSFQLYFIVSLVMITGVIWTWWWTWDHCTMVMRPNKNQLISLLKASLVTKSKIILKPVTAFNCLQKANNVLSSVTRGTLHLIPDQQSNIVNCENI